jgi:hypothetical protein
VPAEVESPYIIRVAIALLMVAASIEGRSVIRNATRSGAPTRASSRTCAPGSGGVPGAIMAACPCRLRARR